MSSPTRRTFLVGATATGKTDVAIALGERLGDVEVCSLDSMCVYREMDIGTAKPSVAQRQRVRHHLIDIADPSEEFSVAEMQERARSAQLQIEATGGRALYVGGTGLYHRAVVDDLEIPGEYPEVRAELDALDTAELYARLSSLDVIAAQRMEPTNRRRALRALEVCVGSGRRFSDHGPGLDRYEDSTDLLIGLHFDRTQLTQRIEIRVNAMIESGFAEEAERLAQRNPPLSRTARVALGYAEMFAYVRGELELETARARIVERTRKFAVRQERWFRRDPRIIWLEADDSELVQRLCDLLGQ